MITIGNMKEMIVVLVHVIRVVVLHTIAITEETVMKMHVNQKVPNVYAKINALTVMMENIVNTWTSAR